MAHHPQAGRTPTLLDQRLARAAAKLATRGVTRPRDFLLKDPRSPIFREGLSEDVVARLRAQAADSLACPLVAGDEAFDEERERQAFLSTGCPGIDELLDGGCVVGEMTEFTGAPATGKTQLAFFTAITTVAADPLATVLYIDSSNSFSPARISELFCDSDRFEFARTPEMGAAFILSRIKCVKCFDACELLDALQDVDQKLSDQSDSFLSRLKFVVVDSVGALFSPLVGFGQTRGYVMMMTVGHMLKDMALRHRFAVLTINYAVQSDFNGSNHNNSRRSLQTPRTTTKPALGTSWSFVPNVRLLFSAPPDDDDDDGAAPAAAGSESQNSAQIHSYENSKGMIMALAKRRVVVGNSHRKFVQGERTLYLGAHEIMSFPSNDDESPPAN
ncbi:hypothetical protein HDU87_001694 [Geranomyces variabilis]|uniref:RecA family profile 1 domain-containing protein n=1 Tax=Geranomyces variabilis TaxID=109894 RepID=A0AAD5TB02_9FUNG|nr:hypothetical protein HDU87_001694 [Geranomyces variabilis]